MASDENSINETSDHLITSTDSQHPANLICTLCRNFYNLGWVTGTGGGTSIKDGSNIFIAPSGVQKELMQPENIFVMDQSDHAYLRKPSNLKPSACTPLFLAAFDKGAGCCIHTHSQWAVLVTLLVEKAAIAKGESTKDSCFEIEKIEQIKGIPRGKDKPGMLGFFDRLQIPIIENTAHEEDLTQSLEEAMTNYPDTYAVLVRRHGLYVWGDDVAKAKTQAESLDYIFRLAVEMRNLGLPWTKEEATQITQVSQQRFTTVNGTNCASKGKRGRPAKSGDSLEDLDQETPRKRKPGRPRKSLEGGLAEASAPESRIDHVKVGRQNQFTVVNGIEGPVNELAERKGSGRPKKVVAGRRLGRPRKTL